MIIFDQNRQQVGLRLKSERERLNMTQTELGEAIGVGRFSITKYEAGGSSPLVDQLTKLDELGADIYYIATGKKSNAAYKSQAEFNRIFLAVQKMVQTMGLNSPPEEVLNASWMLLSLARPADVNNQLLGSPEAVTIFLKTLKGE